MSKIGLVLSNTPGYSETFFVSKIKGLVEAGNELLLFASKGKGLIVLTTGGRISAYGPGSRFGILHDAFGIVPAATGLDTGTHGQPVSFEYILKTNPDWLYVIDRDAAIGREGSPAKSFLDNELVRQTTAWKKNQVVYLEPANWYLVGGGLTALHQSIEQVSKAFDAPGE